MMLTALNTVSGQLMIYQSGREALTFKAPDA